ncbi:hypothetical protein BDW59DRAFT_149395 [Aspergillus cavernicola]|uniref:Shelterin complex subunit TPP1/Est3 domain-containing protein n=1 Tax=Aspergillus cavernicola TaxID=176166 RepID=A0ABR4I6X5_9EURO
MSSSSIWISPFIEHCLSSYQTKDKARPDPNLDWEDDGSNIRFPATVQRHALINTWSEETNVFVANLTDSDTQIDAILSRESLDDYAKTFPLQPLSREGCRGYFIQLANFELVYEYSTGKPKLHLYIKRFSIVWERDKIRAAPQGRSTWKKPALATLIKRVFILIKSRDVQVEKPAKTTVNSNGYMTKSHESEEVNGHTNHTTLPHLMTQLPAHPLPITDPSHSPKHDTTPSDKLLGHFAPPASETRHPSRQKLVDTHSLNQRPASEALRPSRSTSRVFTSDHERQSKPEAQSSKTATNGISTLVDRAFDSEALGPNMDRLSPQNMTGEDISRSNAGSSSLGKSIERTDSPYSSEKQLSAELEASQSVTLRPDTPAKDTIPSITDPWEGMAEIRSIDVTVPKDQEELLGFETHPWYPPPVGKMPVSGRVPPALLDEWNSIASQRNQKAVGLEDDRTTSHGTSVTETDSESEGIPLPWGSSPENSPLPADSPVKGRSGPPHMSRRMSSCVQDGPTATSGPESQNQQENNSIPEVSHDKSASVPLPAPNAERNEQISEPIELDMARHDGDGHESDDSDSDSAMSISIPQPLTGSTQQEMSSQLGAEVSSSGPPLPETTAQHIQVVDTPSAVLNKSRLTLTTNDDIGPSLHQAEPSQAGKSSSQSRILDTYASHDGETRGGPSQHSSKSFPTSEPVNSNRVPVNGIPVSSGALQTQDPNSWSQSNSLWTSSGLKSTELNVLLAPATYQSQSSNAFSSYRELPLSSMLSVDDNQRSPGIQSSARGTPLRRPRGFPLKRFASEMEADSEDGSPSKRSKVDNKPLVPKLETGLDERIISRRQSFIINSAQSIEAARIYEKFRNDYRNYTGDFAHFTKLCSRLQAFREGGSLQRSFLWDDFIIKHLEEYPAYLGECRASEAKPLSYEEYFASSFSRPSFKKRSLTVEEISACAAQIIIIDETPAATSSGPMTDTKTSFTGSLRDQLSNFHTHSFAATQDSHCQDKQSERDDEQSEGEDSQSDTDLESIHSQYSIPDSEPGRAAQGIHVEDMPLESAVERVIPESNRARKATQEYTDEDEDEEMEDVDDTAHETASVELGDDEPPAPVPAPAMALNNIVEEPATKHPTSSPDKIPEQRNIVAHPTKDADVESEPENTAPDEDEPEFEFEKVEEENWFLSLRHIYPTTPVWSDDPNTPFKKWARADQNVLSVRNHRGGANIPVDEKGVIRPDYGFP